MSPGARNSRIFALENMLATSSSALVSMASHLSEAEERECTFSGRGRWNQVKNLVEAKSIMNYLFDSASSSRCKLRDKEVDCREKIAEAKDLKEKNSALEKLSKDAEDDVMLGKRGGLKYNLRKQDNRKSIVLEDMDTSDSEHSVVDPTDDDWVQTCCTCSKSSSCKTMKCECRLAVGHCKASCGCSSLKCSNRESEMAKTDVSIEKNNSTKDETEKDLLASHGAALLQSAMAEKPVETNGDDQTQRKPLSDIGNSLAKSNIPRPNQRKKWKKSMVQLVPVAAPPPSSQPENNKVPQKQDNNNAGGEIDIPLKLPRAMHAAASSGGNLLRERNADRENGTVNKNSGSNALALS